MSFAAVITWFITICFGLLLLGIWLVEYDRDGRRGGASRLPMPVISGHALLAVVGVKCRTRPSSDKSDGDADANTICSADRPSHLYASASR
jgi:hypothetical protein